MEIADHMCSALEIKSLGVAGLVNATHIQFIESNGEHPEKLGRRPATRCTYVEKGKRCARTTRTDNQRCPFHSTQTIKPLHIKGTKEDVLKIRALMREEANDLGFELSTPS
jgi:hypothetical protein